MPTTTSSFRLFLINSNDKQSKTTQRNTTINKTRRSRMTMGCTQSSSVSNNQRQPAFGNAHQQQQPQSKDYSNVDVVPAGPAPPASPSISSKVALGCGCYWGTEKFVVRGMFVHDFEMYRLITQCDKDSHTTSFLSL